MIIPAKFADRSFLRKIGLYFTLMITLGGVGGMLIYILLMQFSGWSLNRNNSFSSAFNASDSVVIYLYKSPSTTKYFASVGGRYDVLTRPWRDYADLQKLDLVEVSSLGQLVADKKNVLVLPSAVALSEDERSDVIRYKAAGGNVLLTWATGSRDGNGKWVGWDFVKQISGLDVVAELPKATETHQILTKGEGPLTYNMEPASQIGLGETAERPILYRGESVAAQAGGDSFAWSSPESPLSVLAFNEFSGQKLSRVVAFGIPETSWEYNQNQMHQLLNGIFSWLARQPILVKSHWPMGMSSAYMIAVNSPDTLGRARDLSKMFQAHGYEGSFFAPSSIMEAQKDVLADIEKDSEVGYLGDSNFGFKGQTEAIQFQRIRKMVSIVPPTSSKARMGFQAPYFSFDVVTEQLLYTNNLRYHLSKRLEYRPKQPYFGAVENERVGERFVILPVRDSDIFGLSQPSASPETDFFQYALKHHEKTVAQGAFGCLVIDSEKDGTTKNFDEQLKRFVLYAKSKENTTWFSNGREISKWWNDRDRFQLRVRPSSVRIEFDISNVGDAAISNASAIVMLPDKRQLPQIRSLKSNQPEPTVRRLDEYRAAIVFGLLPVGDFSYQLSFQ